MPRPGQSVGRTTSQSSGLQTHLSAPAARNCITTTKPTAYWFVVANMMCCTLSLRRCWCSEMFTHVDYDQLVDVVVRCDENPSMDVGWWVVCGWWLFRGERGAGGVEATILTNRKHWPLTYAVECERQWLLCYGLVHFVYVWHLFQKLISKLVDHWLQVLCVYSRHLFGVSVCVSWRWLCERCLATSLSTH